MLVSIVALLGCESADASAHAGLPLRFEPNRGQTASAVRFLARGPGYTLFLTPTESVMVLPLDQRTRDRADDAAAVDLRMRLADSNPEAVATGLEPLAGTASYFVGNDPKLWQTAVPTFGRVRLDDVYPGVDLVYYGNDGRLEYDFVVEPGSEPSKIRFSVEGADSIAIDPSGGLVLSVAGREVRWHKPVCYQDVDGTRRPVDGAYERLADSRFGFRLGSYDRARTLIIDPTLIYATYVAPTSFAAGDGLQNAGLAITADAEGNAYVAGITESASFPVTNGAFRTTRPGKRDVFVAKLNPTASALVYATYLGGSETEIQNGRSLGIAVDDDGNAYIAGATNSTNFPTTAGAHLTTNQGTDDAFVTKLGPSGASLIYSTYVGGTGSEYGWDIAINAAGEAYVCGETNGDFPTTPGAFQTASISLSGFVFKLAANGSDLVYSTTLGTNTGKAMAIAIDADGNAYVTGSADEGHGGTTWPVTPGAFQTTGDSFVTKLDPDGASLVFSSRLGGSGAEAGHGIALDAARNVYVAGNTSSTDFPVSPGAFQTSFQSTPTPVDDGFVIKLNAAGSASIYGTYLGTAVGDDIHDLVVDGAGNAIVTGSTGSTDFPTTDDAFQPTFTPTQLSGSGFVTKVNANGTDLEYSTYLHPTDQSISVLYAIGTDGVGGVYVTGVSAAMFPTTPGVFQSTTWNPGFGGPLVAKLDLAGAATVECGDFNGDGNITASDALGTLRVAVGSGTCAPTVCDFNGDGSMTASDALAILRLAVGQAVTANCPAT